MRDLRNSCRFGFLLLACVFLLIGCEDEEKKKAIEDAEQSRRLLNRAEAKLTRAQKEIADLEALVYAVTDQRDKLEAQVKELLEDQGNVLAAAQDAQDGIRNLTAKSTAQTRNVAALQSRVEELTAIVQSQEKTISEQEATIVELLKTIELQQQSIDGQYGVQEDVNEVHLD